MENITPNVSYPASSGGPSGFPSVHSVALPLILIKRIAMTPDFTLGVVLEEGRVPFCLSLERPWVNNQKEISCIPKGEYRIKRQIKPKHGSCFEVMNVPNRTDILIHKGNFVWDSAGCIIFGEQFENVMTSHSDKPVTSVQQSGVAYSQFMAIMAGKDDGKLIITEC